MVASEIKIFVLVLEKAMKVGVNVDEGVLVGDVVVLVVDVDVDVDVIVDVDVDVYEVVVVGIEVDDNDVDVIVCSQNTPAYWAPQMQFAVPFNDTRNSGQLTATHVAALLKSIPPKLLVVCWHCMRQL